MCDVVIAPGHRDAHARGLEHFLATVNGSQANRVIELVALQPGIRVQGNFGGKQVVNLVLAGAPNKGQALASERDRLRCTWTLFVGDDENDEDAFALEGNTIPVRVGWNRQSKARYYLRTQAEIDELLELLVTLRSTATYSMAPT
jgi:trehalose 6-phosphate phosphatase